MYEDETAISPKSGGKGGVARLNPNGIASFRPVGIFPQKFSLHAGLNPNGIASFSPGLSALADYPGNIVPHDF
jgi:hypothetical protein